MYPSSAQLFVATLSDTDFDTARSDEVARTVDEWTDLAEHLAARYNLDMMTLSSACERVAARPARAESHHFVDM